MLSLDYPVIESGDRGTLNAWRLSGFEDRNTDRGRVWVTTVAAAGVLTVTGYRDEAKTLPVFTGSGPAGSWITLAASGSSGLSGKVWCADASTSLATIAVQVLLATLQDIQEAEDKLEELRPHGSPSMAASFADIGKLVMRQFITDMARIYPPQRSTSDGTSYITGRQPNGSKGLPERMALAIWGMGVDRRFEVVGIDPRAYREWAVRWSLYLLWRRKSGGGDDPRVLKAEWWKRQAEEAGLDAMAPYVDMDGDDTPDGPAEITQVTFRRG